jgi:hypothetical protein
MLSIHTNFNNTSLGLPNLLEMVKPVSAMMTRIYAILLILEINKKYTIALTEKKHQRLGMNDI